MKISHRFTLAIFAFVATLAPGKDNQTPRVTSGLQVLYDFNDLEGNLIKDRSGAKEPLDLKLNRADAVTKHSAKLTLLKPASIHSIHPATRLTQSVKNSGGFTVEAWLKPKTTSQSGPARIVTLSPNSKERNFTLGQNRNRIEVRFRTSQTDPNGTPALMSRHLSLTKGITHVVYTREKSGIARLYVNGKPNATRKVNGDIGIWNPGYRLSLGNELTTDRPWLGDLHLIAIYNRALTPAEVARNHSAGVSRSPGPALEKLSKVNQETPEPALPPEPKPAPPPKPLVNLPPIDLPGGQTLVRVDFERHVLGLFSREGCNTGSCHGSFQGDSDFQLCLFGYDPETDYLGLIDEGYGPFFDLKNPERSDILRKPTELAPHKGGKRFEENGWEYQVLKNWILSGGEHEVGSGLVRSLTVSPADHRFSGPGKTVQLKVEAAFVDGSKEDVTAFCQFETRDDFIAEVDESGRVKALTPGDTAIVVSYRDQVVSSRALVSVPVSFLQTARELIPGSTTIKEPNFIDQEVFTKLAALRMSPSEPATEGAFIRRLYIDTIGRLPSPDEARTYFEDRSPDKRDRKIDELLSHPLHAALWATRFSDITGNNTNALEQPREKRSQMWHDWLRDRFARNVPYDELVRGILVATSREGNSMDQWIRETTQLDESVLDGFDNDYAERDTLDLFWARRNVSLEHLAEQTASAFLGIQLECAQCHKHPYDRWTQEDYRSFASIFGQVKNGNSPEGKKAIAEENKRRKRIKDKKKRLPNLKEVYLDANRPKRQLHPETKQPLAPKALGGPELPEEGDYRASLFEWMTQPDNPFFARAFVNRVWAHYMGVGIVEPVDGLSAANPPSNPQLLDALALDFIEHDYDIRRLERQILSSRTYRLSSMPTDTNRNDQNNYARKYPRRLMAEAVVDVINSALDTSDDFNRDAPKGSSAIEVAVSNPRDSNLSFVFNAFGRPPRTTVCDCERSLDPALPQTLYLMTDSRIQEKIRKGRLKDLLDENDRLEKLRKGQLGDDELGTIVDELFLATLTRFPDEEERTAAFENVRRQPGSEAGLVDVVWALINTREFLLNH